MTSPLPPQLPGDLAAAAPEDRQEPNRHNLPTRLLLVPVLWLLRFYQLFLSPLKPPSCRFYPVCSAYSILAFKRHGLWRGAYLTMRRLARCHPFHPGGYDPVPEVDDDRKGAEVKSADKKGADKKSAEETSAEEKVALEKVALEKVCDRTGQ
jgi:putative membrane protein insertion efficiency factor